MGRDSGRTIRFSADAFADEFGPYAEQATLNPEVRAAYEDAEETHRLLDSLVALRRALRLTQSAVARRMGIRQPAVSEFENESSDPRLSTLQRYARAVEARVRLVVEMPAVCDWISPSLTVYSEESSTVGTVDDVAVSRGKLARTWGDRSNWELTA